MRREASSAIGGPPSRVLVGLGSNRWHGRHGPPERVLVAAAAHLGEAGLDVLAMAPVIRSAPVGPSRRRFANGAILGLWAGTPMELLRLLKVTERAFGRRPGQRWGARVLDLDLLLFEQSALDTSRLTIPHPGLPLRDFVLRPMLHLWPDWKHPRSGLSVRHMAARLAKARPLGLSGAPGRGS